MSFFVTDKVKIMLKVIAVHFRFLPIFATTSAYTLVCMNFC